MTALICHFSQPQGLWVRACPKARPLETLVVYVRRAERSQ